MERKEDSSRRITRRKYEKKAQGKKKTNERQFWNDDSTCPI